MQDERDPSAVVRHRGFERQPGVGDKRDASAETVADRRDVAADARGVEPRVRRTRIRVESLFGDRLELRHRLRKLRIRTVETRRRAVKQLGRDGEKSLLRESVGYVTDVRVDAEGFLKEKQP